MKITRRMWGMAAGAVLALNLGLPAAQAAEEAPDALVKRVSADVLETIKKDASLRNGDSSKINALVNEKVMPYVDFRRMTSAAVGPAWRQATPEQRQKLQDEFKALLIRTYAGALSQVGDQTITVKPVRMAAGDTDVLVRTQVNGRGDPVQLDFRLEKQATGWKLYNFNVLGVWLVETYRNQFAQEINANGIDGLIKTLASRSSMPATATK
ncbi:MULTISPECIES: MlaC/ttg2D family ABC transporter substrate-binding protein [Comamonas]|jgi:phospholipid transport system substrate-binding protein|uniref:Probable phospholipid-binding protein mlaC n=2 Tax=Comamonas TaxID=283 RepID=A0A8B4S1I8_COMTE|nr:MULTISPECIES: ABC transporter substrate-binding protein [Comamonas]KKI14702.1 signal peptide protein [Comamonas thiooxydans]MBL5977326.1 ABC transporter substrate-binding protein [Comamonas sp. NyZ500]QOQ83036.1 ABC transporter substrate-binding protein [Comamonas thiooxydans]QQN70355.1 ABC transporter substrate-binding protein [Comamonas testosteroni]RDI13736.1 phospholipid transport system substrate-binding protein [Comamonas sp. AG1104]